MPAAVASHWRNRRRRIFQSVFQTEVSLPTPHSTPSVPFSEQGQPFGGPAVVSHEHNHHGTATTSAAFFSQAATQEHFDPLQGRVRAAHAPTTSSLTLSTILAQSQSQFEEPLFPSLATAADDQIAYDRAWHVVTARIALPASATADDSFGTLAPDSQQSPRAFSSDAEFYQALDSLNHANRVLPRATHTDDIVSWHAQQVRAHFAQHVIPLLSGCVDENEDRLGADIHGDAEKVGDADWEKKRDRYESHMVTVMSSIRTLEAALRLYFYGLGMLMRGFSRATDGNSADRAKTDAEILATRFRRDIHALVGISASDQLMNSVRVVLVRLISHVLGIPPVYDGEATSRPPRPEPPSQDNIKQLAARQRLHELVEQLYNVGLAGERFQILFAEIMDGMMSNFVKGAYAGVWASPGSTAFSATPNTITLTAASSSSSPCIVSLSDWVENHFARLGFEVLSRISPNPPSPVVTLSDVKTYQSLALGRLAALRIGELFDIVLAWPASRGALDDLRATITTSARRMQLTSSFTRALQTKLLHPGCSTLEILQTYIAIIRTFHALDHSKVLLGHVEPTLQLYLCQREDAIRIVVTGLLASPDEVRAMRKVAGTANWTRENGGQRDAIVRAPFITPTIPGRSATAPSTGRRRGSTPEANLKKGPAASTGPYIPSSSNLVELALLLNDPANSRRAAPDDEDLDWNDMNWVPDPVDAGANYKRPKSEDVIGTLISALGSEDVFIKEFTSILAERLLGDPARFEQELRVLDLLKRRFGEAALQSCDVMIKDVQDSSRLDAAIRRTGHQNKLERQVLVTPAGPTARQKGEQNASQKETQYQARILSRLFWPALDREHFLLPPPILEQQKQYEQGYESLKSHRKLTWLNQLGQTRVELELSDRTVTVDCSTVEATVIYAFQDDADSSGSDSLIRRSEDELYNQLQMDEDLIAAALSFWTSKGVLYRVQPGVYAVAETLAAAPEDNPNDSTASAIATEEGSTEGTVAEESSEPRKPAKLTVGAKEQERRAMYWQYIRGMLTNASVSMPLGQMAMMMKMLITDGFPWSNEELQEFLGEKIVAGDLEIVGGKYKLVKK
ncbi:hypothetical protein B0H66DRAFT_76331 [Apodospora peruviana]|uniref:Anaphase-promoting complex subunit 2 n=1 Tax=Apodospora peruviana TaxID=516989 RepID=A0AAE0ITR7_9PEZI|nr:hypothetical protein B0H66DRAFT_76331 [Apodospora peruviana]